MVKWFGSAGVCINENNEVLMVYQGAPNEAKTWSVPSGEKKYHESYEGCCIRELEEETGLKVEIVKELIIKKGKCLEVHYFLVRLIGGYEKIQDPDGLIYQVAWKSKDALSKLEISYKEDLCLLNQWLDGEFENNIICVENTIFRA